MIGRRFERLLVLARHSGGKNTSWLCRCDCGTELVVVRPCLIRGQKSCGCWILDHPQRLTHGASADGQDRSKAYNSWASMRARCLDPGCPSYPAYGGRGISICDRWADFDAFLADMGERPTSAHSIDRIDNEWHYQPDNCRWATRTQQNRNTRRNRRVTINGETRCVSEWAEIAGLHQRVIWKRLSRGWSGAALLSPKRSDLSDWVEAASKEVTGR